MNNQNPNKKDEQEILEELENIIDSVIDTQTQYELYCQAMKELFLAGSTNN